MAIQKRRISQTRAKKSRTHWKVKVPNLVPCAQCKTLILAHTRCYNCGYYKGKEVVIPRLYKETATP